MTGVYSQKRSGVLVVFTGSTLPSRASKLSGQRRPEKSETVVECVAGKHSKLAGLAKLALHLSTTCCWPLILPFGPFEYCPCESSLTCRPTLLLPSAMCLCVIMFCRISRTGCGKVTLYKRLDHMPHSPFHLTGFVQAIIEKAYAVASQAVVAVHVLCSRVLSQSICSRTVNLRLNDASIRTENYCNEFQVEYLCPNVVCIFIGAGKLMASCCVEILPSSSFIAFGACWHALKLLQKQKSKRH